MIIKGQQQHKQWKHNEILCQFNNLKLQVTMTIDTNKIINYGVNSTTLMVESKNNTGCTYRSWW